MNDYKVHMSEQDDNQCQQILLLFSDFLKKQKEICVAKSDDFGYIYLSDIVYGTFEYNAICQTARSLFEEIMFAWEANYMYDIVLKNGDLEMPEPVLTPEQQKEFDKIKNYFNEEMEKIVAGK